MRSVEANQRIHDSLHCREGKAKSWTAGRAEGAGFGRAKELGRWEEKGQPGRCCLEGSELRFGMMILAAGGIRGNIFADRETSQGILAMSAET